MKQDYSLEDGWTSFERDVVDASFKFDELEKTKVRGSFMGGAAWLMGMLSICRSKEDYVAVMTNVELEIRKYQATLLL